MALRKLTGKRACLPGVFLALLCLYACLPGIDDPKIVFLNPSVDSLSFSGCLPGASPFDPSYLTVRTANEGYLDFSVYNSELCCDTDSLLVYLQFQNDSCFIHIIDLGPYSWCFCPEQLSFRAGPFEQKELNFILLESQSAFKRDTFRFTLNLNLNLPVDTTLLPVGSGRALPPELLSLELKGCNQLDSASAVISGQTGADTTWLAFSGDTVLLTTALNYGCCAPFSASYDSNGDTLCFYVEDLCNYPEEYCYCDCSCTYLFTFKMKKREESLFPYKVFLINAFNENPVLLWWGAIDTRVFR